MNSYFYLMEKLPDEMLLVILNYLDQGTYQILCFVKKFFLQILQKNAFQKKKNYCIWLQNYTFYQIGKSLINTNIILTSGIDNVDILSDFTCNIKEQIFGGNHYKCSLLRQIGIFGYSKFIYFMRKVIKIYDH